MADCAKKGVKAAVIITAGFAETGPAGAAMQDEFMKIAKDAGIRVVGPNCMGMWSAAASLPAFMFPLPILDGPLALISQGGNVGGALVSDAVNRGIGFRQYVSCGGTADIQIEDYIEYLGQDDSVKVIMLYIEGLGDGKRFIEKVSKVTVKKPVIALKPGKTEAAAKAISSHSGSLSGLDAVYNAAFKKSGVVRVDTSHEMLDLAIAMINQPLPLGRNVVITTPGGSYGVMCADACAVRGLDVIDLPEHILVKFNEMFPSRWSHGNPVDPAGDRNFIPYFLAPKMLLECPEVDGLIFMGFGSFSSFADTWNSAGGDITKRIDEMREKMKGLKGAAQAFARLLEAEDYDKIKMVLKTVVAASLGSVMTIEPDDLEVFSNDASSALVSQRMRESSFYTDLRKAVNMIINEEFEQDNMAKLSGLIAPIIDALIDSWIRKYNKPVITTTFTEETAKMGELGHFPYPNADRAANVLAKLVEYREYLEGAEEQND